MNCKHEMHAPVYSWQLTNINVLASQCPVFTQLYVAFSSLTATWGSFNFVSPGREVRRWSAPVLV